MKYRCPKCGELVEEGLSFCTNCGQKFNWPEVAQPITDMKLSGESTIEQRDADIKDVQVESNTDEVYDLSLEETKGCSFSKIDKIVYAILTLLTCALLYIPGYCSTYISIDRKRKYFDESFCELVDYSHNLFGDIVVIVITLILLFMLFAFISQKKKLKNIPLICIIGSALSTFLVFIFSIIDASGYDIDGYIDGDYVTIKFDGFEIIFVLEILMLIILTVVSVLNYRGKPISAMFKK